MVANWGPALQAAFPLYGTLRSGLAVGGRVIPALGQWGALGATAAFTGAELGLGYGGAWLEAREMTKYPVGMPTVLGAAVGGAGGMWALMRHRGVGPMAVMEAYQHLLAGREAEALGAFQRLQAGMPSGKARAAAFLGGAILGGGAGYGFGQLYKEHRGVRIGLGATAVAAPAAYMAYRGAKMAGWRGAIAGGVLGGALSTAIMLGLKHGGSAELRSNKRRINRERRR